MTRVNEHKRTLANGKRVTIGSYDRTGPDGDGAQVPPSGGSGTPAQQHRRQQLKAESQRRRKEAMRRGKAATKKGWKRTKKQGRKTKRILRRGGKRLARAYHMAHRKKKLGAGMLALGGVAEIGAALSYQLVGVAVTTVAIAVAVIGGGLLIGGEGAKGTRKSSGKGATSRKSKSGKSGKSGREGT